MFKNKIKSKNIMCASAVASTSLSLIFYFSSANVFAINPISNPSHPINTINHLNRMHLNANVHHNQTKNRMQNGYISEWPTYDGSNKQKQQENINKQELDKNKNLTNENNNDNMVIFGKTLSILTLLPLTISNDFLNVVSKIVKNEY